MVPFTNSVQRCAERIAKSLKNFIEATPIPIGVQDLLCRYCWQLIVLGFGHLFTLYIWILVLCSIQRPLPIRRPHSAEAMFAGTVKQPVAFDLELVSRLSNSHFCTRLATVLIQKALGTRHPSSVQPIGDLVRHN